MITEHFFLENRMIKNIKQVNSLIYLRTDEVMKEA